MTPPKPGEGKQSPNGNGKATAPDATDMFLGQHASGTKAGKKPPAKKAPAKAAPKAKAPRGKR